MCYKSRRSEGLLQVGGLQFFSPLSDSFLFPPVGYLSLSLSVLSGFYLDTKITTCAYCLVPRGDFFCPGGLTYLNASKKCSVRRSFWEKRTGGGLLPSPLSRQFLQTLLRATRAPSKSSLLFLSIALSLSGRLLVAGREVADARDLKKKKKCGPSTPPRQILQRL